MAWSGWWRWGAATLVVLLLAVPTAVAWFGVGPERAASVATILALLAIAGSVFRWAQRSSRGTAISTPAQIDEAARTLATLVEQQWRHEVRIRLLTDPAPLTVQWKAADPELGDHHWLAGTLSGRTDDVSQLIEAFRRLPQPRLVILGGPGAGKTTLAVLLTLALCDRPSDRDPVPVLLAPGSWDPATEHLHTWIKRRLGEDYPALRATVFGPTAIEGLVAGLRVLPVVDGLDELPESSARDALVRICQALADRDPLIVTCRTEEYRSMVAASDVITAAAVIEAQKVDPGDVVAYLEMVVPPGGRSQRWQPVFDHLRVHHHRNGPLATALSTPLMVSLLRNVYANAPADPAELVNPHRFPDRASIESHLLNALIPTSIALTRPEPAWRARAWDVEASQRWLSFLATHLNRLGTRDLRWWHLYRHLPTRVWRLVLGLVFGLGLGLVFVLGLGLLFGLLFGLGLGLGFGLLFGLVVGIEAGPKALGAEPARASWRLRGRVRSLIARLGVGVGLGLASGLVFGLPGGLALELPGGLVSALGFGLVAGLLGGLTTWLRVPSSDDRGATPLSTIDGTRTLVLAVATCAVALVFGLGVALMFGLGVVFALWFGLVFGLGMGLVVGFAVGVMSDLLPGAWVPFVIVRLWLALRRQLPWRLIAFLEDCHRLGILRQVGPVYQFRHARLQDHLARPLTNPSASAHTHTP